MCSYLCSYLCLYLIRIAMATRRCNTEAWKPKMILLAAPATKKSSGRNACKYRLQHNKKVWIHHLRHSKKAHNHLLQKIFSSLDKFWTVGTHLERDGHILDCPDTVYRLIFKRPQAKIIQMDPNLPGGSANGIFRPLEERYKKEHIIEKYWIANVYFWRSGLRGALTAQLDIPLLLWWSSMWKEGDFLFLS